MRSSRVVWGVVWLLMPKSQQSRVQSQHPPTQWNLRGGIWSSVEYIKKSRPKMADNFLRERLQKEGYSGRHSGWSQCHDSKKGGVIYLSLFHAWTKIKKSWNVRPQSTYRGRREIGEVYLSSQLEHTPLLCLWWQIEWKVVGEKSPRTRLGWLYHNDDVRQKVAIALSVYFVYTTSFCLAGIEYYNRKNLPILAPFPLPCSLFKHYVSWWKKIFLPSVITM